ncbi:unnamed protein product [Pleuronectes platessa]|uniref:Uncharacterized protein n=1 Tax=Pleuronectes platessa TaxID=8262 RepID=A0A9N7W029_PLEPL|nr:unnamed protein product [Pleuronectes platessa]
MIQENRTGSHDTHAIYIQEDSLSCINSAFSFPGQDLKALRAPLAVHTTGGYANHHSTGAYYGNLQGSVCPPSPPT